jgi:nucleotide-binding universal stress UspA family protein
VFNKIFAGYDGAGRSEDALALARRLARIGPGTVTAVYGLRLQAQHPHQ